MSQLWPQNAARPTTPPFVDSTLPGGTRITGQIQPAIVRCTQLAWVGPIGNQQRHCNQRSELVPYRA